MKKYFKILGYLLMFFCVTNLFSAYQKTKNERYTFVVYHTVDGDGSMVSKIEEEKLTLLEGNFRIQLPPLEYVPIENAKVWMGESLLLGAIGLILLIASEPKNKRQNQAEVATP